MLKSAYLTMELFVERAEPRRRETVSLQLANMAVLMEKTWFITVIINSENVYII